MFSRAEKNKIAQAVEDVLRDINHPEMDLANNPVRFFLHVEGAADWSWADIEPNRPELTVGTDPNPWNEISREIMKEGEK